MESGASSRPSRRWLRYCERETPTMRSQCIAFAAMTALAPGFADAQGSRLCAPRADIVAQLEKK
ncbi:MAG: hypothetical protein ACK4WC_10735, partial [Rubrimonas sp.]